MHQSFIFLWSALWGKSLCGKCLHIFYLLLSRLNITAKMRLHDVAPPKNLHVVFCPPLLPGGSVEGASVQSALKASSSSSSSSDGGKRREWNIPERNNIKSSSRLLSLSLETPQPLQIEEESQNLSGVGEGNDNTNTSRTQGVHGIKCYPSNW